MGLMKGIAVELEKDNLADMVFQYYLISLCLIT